MDTEKKSHDVAWTRDKIRDFWRVIETRPDLKLEFYPDMFYDMILWQASEHLPSGGDALDVGPGVGKLLRTLAGRGWRIHGTDISEAGLDELRRTLKSEGLEADLKVGTVLKIPFPDASMDAVFFTEVIEHLMPEDIAPGLKEMRRVLKPGGRLVVTTPYKEPPSRVLCPDCHAVYHPYQHLQSFDEAKVERILTEAGFTPRAIDVMPMVAPAETEWKNLLKKQILRWLRPAAFRLWGRGGFLIVAEKPA